MTAANTDNQYFDVAGSNFGGTGTSGNFMPEIYSKKVLNFFRKSSVAEAITNTDYAGEISSYGDSVRIIKEPTIDVYAYERGADTTATSLSENVETLVVDRANAFKFIVDDIETNMSHVNFKEVAASSAAYALRDKFDQGVLEILGAGASGSFTPFGGTGTSDHIIAQDGTPANSDNAGLDADSVTDQAVDLGFGGSEVDPLDFMARMARLLDEANVPEEGRWFVASPAFFEQLSQSASNLMSVDFNAGQGSLRNGLVSSGKLRGFDMYKSNNITNGSNANVALAGHVSACATAQTIVNTEVIRDPSSFGDIVRGLHVYGADVIRQEALVKGFYTID
jgi:hypothetical protein